MNSPQYFEIHVADIQRAKAFYESVFGWHIIRDETFPMEYYRIQTEGINGGMLVRPMATTPMPTGTNAAVISMQVSDYDATAANILEHGGIVALPKFAVPGTCWQGYFADTEHNTLGIFQVDPSAA